MFRYGETKQFLRNIVIPAHSLIPETFRYHKFSITQKGFSTKFFGSVRQETFDWNREYPSSPHLSKNFFDTSFFMKHRRVPLRVFSALRDKKLSTEKSDIPFLWVRFFHTQFLLKYGRVPLRNFSVLSGDTLTKNRDSTTLPLIHNIFWYRNFSETQKGFPTKFFTNVREENVWRKIVILPSTPFSYP